MTFLSYLFCSVNFVGWAIAERVGGQISYRLDLDCKNLYNPKIYLPQEAIQQDQYNGGHLHWSS